MNSYELAAWSVKTGGKIRHKDWWVDKWVNYNGSFWVNEIGVTCQPSILDINGWEKYEELKKKVKMYRPDVIRVDGRITKPLVQEFQQGKTMLFWFPRLSPKELEEIEVLRWDEVEV